MVICDFYWTNLGKETMVYVRQSHYYGFNAKEHCNMWHKGSMERYQKLFNYSKPKIVVKRKVNLWKRHMEYYETEWETERENYRHF